MYICTLSFSWLSLIATIFKVLEPKNNLRTEDELITLFKDGIQLPISSK